MQAKSKKNYTGPVVLVVMDGVGIRQEIEGNAVALAYTEFLHQLEQNYPKLALQASGEAVGILAGQMGNSEVGHNALGSGQIIKQGIAKINQAFSTGEIWQSSAWQGAIENLKTHQSTLHFSGIFSDGGVHSELSHLFAMLRRAAESGIKTMRVHAVFDGRDVAPQSAEKYLAQFNQAVAEIKKEFDVDIQIASGGGRMVFIADRYQTDWSIVERGWQALVHGQAAHYFNSADAAIKHFRESEPSLQDQYLPAFVVTDQEKRPVGLVQPHDSFIYFDFRADRALEIAEAFCLDDFQGFNRGTEQNQKLPIYFASLTEYDVDRHFPEHTLVAPVEIHHTLHEYLAAKNIAQLACSETAKFGHITYYFNGNSYEPLPGEEFLEIKSDTRPYDERPWMKSAEITDAVIEKMANFDFVRINFAGGDMVGHFGELEPTVIAMEAIDLQLQRLAKKVDELGGMMLITADHGNAEELFDTTTHQAKTSHTTNLVPCYFYDNTEFSQHYRLNNLPDAGLTNIAATVADLLISEHSEYWCDSLIELK